MCFWFEFSDAKTSSINLATLMSICDLNLATLMSICDFKKLKYISPTVSTADDDVNICMYALQ